jgi:hypothetical protein
MRLLAVRCRRNRTYRHRERYLDQPGHPGRGPSVSDAGADGAECAAARWNGREYFEQHGQFGQVAGIGRRSVPVKVLRIARG